MNKSIRIIVLVLILILVCSAVSFAAGSSYTKQLTASYVGITLVVDGETITPKDANGNLVDPFIVDGTTYLPVRAVAEALGKEVSWDGSTKTVYIGKEPEAQPTPSPLPTLAPEPDIKVDLPTVPLSLSVIIQLKEDIVANTIEITEISYEVLDSGSVRIYFSGKITYVSDDKNWKKRSCEFAWRLYDMDGYLVDYDYKYIRGLEVGDKFKDEYFTINSAKVKYGEHYRLVLSDVMD